MRLRLARALVVLLALAGLTPAGWANAQSAATHSPTAQSAEPGAPAEDLGRPKLKLDHLEFPAILGGGKYKDYLKRRLTQEARKLDWGAGRGSTIEYRFAVEKLEVAQKGRVLEVKCSAVGRLPRGKTARSQLTFSGEASQQTKLIQQVLDIVARGVLTRLAELERKRRGQEP